MVGAPRCGTTALSRYLSQHPQICFSRPKETHFLFESPNHYSSFQAYLDHYQNQFFGHCRQSHQAIGEGSVTYLYSDEVLHRILKMNPNVKLIAMVRNPIDLVRSYHFRMLYLMDEDCWDFQKAWDYQEPRSRGENIPPLCRDPNLLLYKQVGKIGERIERLLEIAGRDRCLILVFDDFKQNPRAIYQQICEFIGVEDDGRMVFPRRQESQFYRFSWLQRLLFHPPQAVTKWANDSASPKGMLWEWQKLIFLRLHRAIRSLNAVKQHPPALTPEMKAHLQDTFTDDVERLSELLHRDLTPWVKPSVTAQQS